MSTEIDSLSVKLEAEGKEVSDSLSRLASSLDKLAKRADKLSAVSAGLKQLQSGLNGLSNKNVTKLSMLVGSLEKLGRVKIPSMTGFSNGMKSLAEIDAEPLVRVVSAVERMSGFNAKFPATEKFAEGIWELSEINPESLNRATDSIVRLSGLDIKLPSIGKFVGDIERLSTASLEEIQQRIQAIAQAIQDLNERTNDNGLRQFISDLAAVSRNADRATKAVQNAAQGAVGNNSPPSEAEAAGSVNSTSAVGKIASRASEIFAKLSPSIKAANERIKEFTSRLSAFAKTSQGALKAIPRLFYSMAHPIQTASSLFERMKSGLSGITGGFRRASSASSGFSNNLLTIIARSAMYSAIFSGISLVTNGVSTGILNLYYANSQFAASMDRCATEAQYLQNSIAAALSPAIEALTPVLEFVVDRFVDFINVVNMCIATITGQSTWTRAVKTPATYADALDGASDSANNAAKATKNAADAAEEYKRTLMGFDEINKLDDPNSSSGSSGNGGSGGSGGSSGSAVPDYASMFTTEQVALDSTEFGAALQDFINQLKDKIAAGDWYGVGVTLADGFGQAVDYLDEFITSPALQNKIYKAVDAVTDVINGFFAEMTYSDGTKASIAERTGDLIGDAISLALNTVDRYLTGVEWGNIGRAVAQGINGTVKSLNENDVSFGTVLADLLNAGISGLSGFTETVSWSGVGEFVAQNVNDFFTTTDWKTAGATASDLISGLAEMLDAAITNINKEEIGQSIVEFFTGLDPLDIAVKIGKLGIDLAAAQIEVLGGITSGITDAIFGDSEHEALEQGILDEWGATSKQEVVRKKLVFAVDWAQGKTQEILEFLSPENIGKWLDQGLDIGVSLLQNGWETVQGWVEDFGDDPVGQLIELVKDGWKTIEKWIGKIPVLSQAMKLIKSGWSTVKKWIGSIPVLSQAMKLIKSGWSTVKGWIGNIPTVSQLVKLAKSGWSSVKSWIGSIPVVSAGVKLVKNGWKSLSSFIGSFTKSIGLSVSWKTSGLSTVQQAVARVLFGSAKWPSLKFAARGGIVDTATLFGSGLVAGEAGREAILPLENNTEWMNTWADKAAEKVVQRIGGNSGGNQPITIYVTLDGKVVYKSVVNYAIGEAKATGQLPWAAYT